MTDLCPCQKKESDMREAAAVVACPDCAIGQPHRYSDSFGEVCGGRRFRALPLQPCTCSPGIVAVGLAAIAQRKTRMALRSGPPCSMGELTYLNNANHATWVSLEEVIRAVEEEDND